jgi:FlaA1/EpsC-like NDP-sugar epimerase
MPDLSNSTESNSMIHRVSRILSLLVIYSAVLSLCRYVAYEVRFDFVVPKEFQQERLWSVLLSLPVKLGFLLLFRQFGSLLTYFSVPDLLRIVAAIGCANLSLYLSRWGLSPGIMSPRGVVLIDFVLAVGALASLRLGLRIYRERFLHHGDDAGQKIRRIAVLGAGDAGAQFVREAQARPALGLRPVFFLDDDRRKHGRDLHGVQVVGIPEQIGELRKDNPIDACVLAMPSAPGKRLQEIYKLLSSEGLKVEIIPSVSELASGRVHVTKIRPVQVDDLLGRAPVDLRSPGVAALVNNKVVLITGAGGSIGSELCRQICGYNPQRVLLVEQAEGSLFNIESELNELGFQNRIVPLVADILDLPRMRGILELYSPEIIFHAAAHKHVFMMERQPGEALKNNVTGTRQFAELAADHKVEVFVLISTDKAINPTSAMGASKRLAELHLQAIQARPNNQTRFIAVRFGNVLGSSGSVIPIFKRQIAEGGPVTVTHPDVTRYFMTIPEAVGLVLQTAEMGKGGEIFVLDMGKPVKIIDLARQLIELSGLKPEVDIEIKIIGLRAGEKLYEELQHTTENLSSTTHPRIMLLAINGSAKDPDWSRRCIVEVEQRVADLNSNQLKQAIQRLVPEYHPHLD